MFADHPMLKPFLNLEPDTFPAEAICQVITHQQELAPLLLTVLRDFAKNPEDYSEQDGNCLHIVALTVLAQFQEPAVFPVLADIINDFDQDDGDWDSGAAYEALVFSVSENGLERIVASIMVSDIGRLKEIIVDKTLGLELRTQALESMKCFYFEGDMSRGDLTDFLSSLFREFKSEHLETDILPLWLVLYDECLAIHPKEMLEDIRDACEAGVLGEELNGRSLIRATDYCTESPDQWFLSNREQLLTEFGYIRHADKELENWGMNQYLPFEDMLGELDTIESSLAERAKQRAQQNELIGNAYQEIFHESANTPFVREEPRVGRNEPCLCGSGKKFKQCCGR